MGGFGSGRTGERPVNDQSLALSLDRRFHQVIAELQRAGSGIRQHTLTWSISGRRIAAIGVLVVVRGLRDASMVLVYSCNGESVREVLAIIWTATPFGWRPWWSCPGCGRRCSRLYNPNGRRWRCRICYNVTYTSSNESDKRLAYGRLWGLLDRDRNDLDSMSTGALIMALRGHKRLEEYITRDYRRVEKAARRGRPGRPHK